MGGKHELVGLFADAVADAEKAGVVTRGQLLELLDKAPSSFGNEMNPWPSPERKNKLGIEDAHTVLKFINDTRVLQRMAAEMGYRIEPLTGDQPDGKDMDEECLQGFQALSGLVAGIKGGLPYTELIALHEHAHKELEDIIKRARAEQTQAKGRRAA